MTDHSETVLVKNSQNDDIHQYLSDIRRIPMLTEEEERQLAKQCASGDTEAIRKMVNANLRLVVYVAKEYVGRGVPLLDLIQEGSIGLLVAARKYDYTLDYRFSTYATKWIRQRVTRSLLNNSGMIRIPLHTAEKIKKIESVRTELQKENGTDPSPSEIARLSGINEQKVHELMNLTPEVFSLDIPAGENEKNTVADFVEDLDALQPQEALIRQELEDIIQKMLSSLNERQQRILKLHFGMEDGKVYSLEEIGAIMGISKERARQLERQAMDKLQVLGTSMGLEEYLE